MISCAIMMSLFCCKDTKNIVSRRIVIGRLYLLVVEMCEKTIKNMVALLVSN